MSNIIKAWFKFLNELLNNLFCVPILVISLWLLYAAVIRGLSILSVVMTTVWGWINGYGDYLSIVDFDDNEEEEEEEQLFQLPVALQQNVLMVVYNPTPLRLPRWFIVSEDNNTEAVICGRGLWMDLMVKLLFVISYRCTALLVWLLLCFDAIFSISCSCTACV